MPPSMNDVTRAKFSCVADGVMSEVSARVPATVGKVKVPAAIVRTGEVIVLLVNV